MGQATEWIFDASGPGWATWTCTMSGESPIITPAREVVPYADVTIAVSGHKGMRVSSWHLEGSTALGEPVYAPLNSTSVNAGGGASDTIALALGTGEFQPIIFAVLESCVSIRAVTGGVGDEHTRYVMTVLLQHMARK